MPALRKLAVISIVDKVSANANHQLAAADVREWERTTGKTPSGRRQVPGATLETLKLLHLERKILLHGHEPLDADSTPTRLAEDWLMNNGCMQAEGDTTPKRR